MQMFVYILELHLFDYDFDVYAIIALLLGGYFS